MNRARMRSFPAGMTSSLTRASAPQTARRVNELSEWRVTMARGIKTNRIVTPRIMTWVAVAWIAVWLTPYLYAVNDLITWR